MDYFGDRLRRAAIEAGDESSNLYGRLVRAGEILFLPRYEGQEAVPVQALYEEIYREFHGVEDGRLANQLGTLRASVFQLEEERAEELARKISLLWANYQRGS